MGVEARSAAHVPALDGLRAVAVLAVIGYHYGIAGFSGGFLGVDLFFVLSGFLITRLLLDERRASGTIDLARFWARRIRRLLPASTLMVGAVAVWGWSQLPAHQLGRLRHDLLTTVGYVANWGFISSGQSYFDTLAEPSPLRHVWSLAIEEQFYLVWPVLVLALLRLARGRTWLLASSGVVGVACSTAAMWLLHDEADPSRAYYGTDTRAAQLLVGALLAVALSSRAAPGQSTACPRGRGSWRRSVVAAAGLVAVVSAVTGLHDDVAAMYTGGFLVFSLVVALVVWAVVDGDTVTSRLLSWRPLTAIGAVSYGLYLWHWPVQVALSEARTPWSGWRLTLVRLATTGALAVVSYRLVESPVRLRSGWGRLRSWRLPAVAASAVTASVVVTFVATAGATDVPRYLDGRVGEIALAGSNNGSATGATDEATPRSVVLIGDSVALSLEEGMAAEAAGRGWDFSMVARWSCAVTDMAPADHGCSIGRPEFLANIAAVDAPIIVWYSNWDGPVNFYDAFDGVPGSASALTNSFGFLRRLDRTARTFIDTGARVEFVLGPQLAAGTVSPAWDANIAAARSVYRAYHAMNPENTALLDLASAVCPAGAPCPPTVDGVELRPLDGTHYGPEGARWVARWIFDRLEERVPAR